MPVENAIHAFVRAHRGRGGAVPRRDRQGPVRQSAWRLRPLRRNGREAPGRARLRRRAAQGSGGAGQGQRHGLGDQPDRAKQFGQGGPTIALNAHGDVVPPGTGWTRDPYGAEIVDGWMVGRGAAVSKSDIATYAFAILALEKCGAELNGTVELHVTYDEEAGGEIGPRRSSSKGCRSRIWRSAPASPTPSSTPTTAVCISRSRSSAARRTPPGPSPASTRSRPPTRS